MEKYDMMRDSGRPWLGRVPQHWRILRMKNVFEVVSERNHPDAEVLSLYREYGVLPKSSRDDNHNVTSEDTASYKFVHRDDLVINKMKAWQGSLGISQYEGIVSPAYYVCRFINDGVSKRYYHYLLRSKTYAQEFERLSTGMRVGQWDLGIDDFMKVPALIPPLEEQQAIAAYLDDQVAQIDSIIAEVQASIEEYKQWRSAVILEAVTKGLNTNIETRPSNIEWMGNIPNTWKTVRFSKANWIRARLGWKGLKAEEYVDIGYPFLSAFNIVDNHLVWTPLNFITQERYDESPEIKISCGDVLLVKDGAGIGKCARIDSLPLGEATVNSSLAVITPVESVDYRYEYYYLQSRLFANIINRLRNGMGVPHLTQEAMKEIRMPLPAKEEQVAIADYLDKRIADMDVLIAEKESLIADLESYKCSLIYETVTGKRKVV